MNSLKFLTLIKDLDGSYFISDHNNEELDVIVRSYLVKEIRSSFLNNYNSFNNIKSKNKKFHLLKQKDDIIILLYDKCENPGEEDNPLEIMINSEKLKEIFESIENFQKMQVNKIIISKQQDNYIIETQS